MKTTILMMLAILFLASISFAQVSAVGYKTSPSPNTNNAKNSASHPSDLIGDYNAQSDKNIDYTITQPGVGESQEDRTSVIPEPSTILLVGAGLAAVGIRRKFRK
ncbi:MAG: PEP-CTERM sorting domain-containing protein [Candidatus Zixiibacteriota bacterium]